MLHRMHCAGTSSACLPANVTVCWPASAAVREPLPHPIPPTAHYHLFAAVPSSSRLATGGGQPTGEPVTWDEMGQLGLHKALNEYYKVRGKTASSFHCVLG